ncbi:hypothetical protein M9H77_17665 [Catharanthus roseus]|uniref:Uncharacterized protein n=1 Tax=Catharanthus roseus TaxID=4058 RepID=A0ACC0B5A6_CATRO|nr:hypothetical protein M9H77_17665 [Catharanthus roseus]
MKLQSLLPDREFAYRRSSPPPVAGEISWVTQNITDVCLGRRILTKLESGTIPTHSDTPGSSSTPTTQPSSSTAPSTNPMAWKPHPGDIRQLLTMNIDRCKWDSTVFITKMRQVWEVKIGDRMRDLLVDAWAARKRPLWILEMSSEQMMKYWESPTYKVFCEWNKRNRNKGRGVSEQESTHQTDLIERFSKSRHLEELHKHQTRDKKGQYTKFHEARQKAEEEAATTGTPMPHDLQLMATISTGLSHGWLYKADSKAAHLRA